MANYGNFAGGLAQSLNAGMPMLMQQQHQQTEEELRKQQLAETIRQHTIQQDKDALDGLVASTKQMVDADPEKAGDYAISQLQAWAKSKGIKPLPFFMDQIKQDPVGTLTYLQTQDISEVTKAIGDPRALGRLAPLMAEAQREGKVRATLGEEPQLRQDLTEQAEAKGIPSVIAAYHSLIQTRDKLAKIGAKQEVLKEFDTRIKDTGDRLDKLTSDPNVKSMLIQAGIDPAFFSSGSFAAALAGQRSIEATQAGAVARQKAFGEAAGKSDFDLGAQGGKQAEFEIAKERWMKFGGAAGAEAGKWSETRISPEMSSQFGLPLGSKVSDVIGATQGGITQGPGGQVVLQHPESIKQDINDATKILETQPAVEEGGRRIALVKKLFKETNWDTGPMTGAVQKKFKELFSPFADSKTLDNIQTIDQLMNFAAIDLMQKMRPASDTDRQFALDQLKLTDKTRAAAMRILDVMDNDFHYNKALTDAAGEYRKGDARFTNFTSIRERHLQEFNKARDAGYPEVKPVVPQTKDEAIRSTKRMVIEGVSKAPAYLQKIVPAMVDVESGFNPSVVHRADAKGERAVGIVGIKPSTGKDFGLPGVQPLDDPSDVVGSVNFTVQELSTLVGRYKGSIKDAIIAHNQGFPTVDAYRAGGESNKDVAARYHEGEKYYEAVMKRAQNAVFHSKLDADRQAAQEKDAGRVTSKNIPLRTAGRFALETGLSAAGGFAGGAVGNVPGTMIGGALGAAAGSKIASETFDPVENPNAEAAKSGAFALVGGVVANKVLKLLVGPSKLTPEGAAAMDILESRGKGNLALPGNVMESAIVQQAHKYGRASSIAGKRLDDIAEKAGAEIEGFAKDYVKPFVAADIKAKAAYQVFDQYAPRLALKLDPVKAQVTQAMRKHSLSIDSSLKGEWDKLLDPKVTKASLEQLQIWKSDAWATWRGLQDTNSAAAKELSETIRFVDNFMDSSLARVNPQAAAAGKAASAAWKEHAQGMTMESILIKSAPYEGAPISGEAILRSLRADKLRDLPTDLTKDQIANLTKVGQALIATENKSSAFQFGAKMGEVIGLGKAGTGTATGVSNTFLFAPSVLARAMSNEKFANLLIRGLRVAPGTQQAYVIGTELTALLTEAAIAKPVRE